MPITWLDIIVLLFMLLSGLLAMARGFTREVLSILSWAAAAAATLVLFPRFQIQVREMLQPNWLADIALVFGIFLVTLIIVTFLTVRIADRVLDSRIGALDRTMGFLFGLARGLIIVVIGYLFFTWLVPEENQPGWVREAKSRPLLDFTGERIKALLPEDPEATINKIKPKGLGAPEDNGEAPSDAPVEPSPDQRSDTTGSTTDPVGYLRTERQGLNQLLESTRANTQ